MSSLSDLRALAREYLLWLGSSEQGRSMSSPEYRAMVEGRVYPPPGSSCGDCAHWLLYRLGVRESWINRAEHDGWHFGEQGGRAWDNNVTTLVARGGGTWGVNPHARRATDADHYECGDVIVVNCHAPATTHVVCVLEHSDGELLSCDGGQPHVALRRRAMTIGVNPATLRKQWKLGGRWVDSWLPLDELADRCPLAEPEPIDAYRARLRDGRLRGVAPAPAPTGARVLREGDRGPEVSEWQLQLLRDGYAVGTVDGIFGARTAQATRRWQADRGLLADAVVGPKTRAKVTP